MGPDAAAALFLGENPDADRYKVVLYGSLARTGRGHMTDAAVLSRLGSDRTQVVFDTETAELPHPNTLDLFAYQGGRETARMRCLSVGGGAISVVGRPDTEAPEVYPENSFAEIAELCKRGNMRISDYVESREGPEIWDYLHGCWQAMKQSINALSLANFLASTRKISFDLVVQTMYETGCDLRGIYRETAEGGLAKLYEGKKA